MASISDLKNIKGELENVMRMLNGLIHAASAEESGSRVGRDPIPLTPAYDTRSIMSTVSVNKHIHDTASQVSKVKTHPATTSHAAAPYPKEDFNDVFGNLSQMSMRS
jgi:hypothetical protein